MRKLLVVLALLVGCGVCHGKEERWSNFAEDGDLKYYLDLQSVVPLPDSVYVFWVKSVAKDKEYFKREYRLNNISYVFTNYELDCAVSSYRIRGTIMFDKQRRAVHKLVPPLGEISFEPVAPESLLELAQDEICVQEESAANVPQSGESEMARPTAADLPAAPESPAAAVQPPSIM